MKSPAVLQRVSTASVGDMHQHLLACDQFFNPPLSDRLDVGEYAAKLKANAHTFEAWQADVLVGLVAVYVNLETGIAFVSSVSTLAGFEGRGIAKGLLETALDQSYAMGCHQASLEVSRQALSALAIYRKLGFCFTADDGDSNLLKLTKSIRRSENS